MTVSGFAATADLTGGRVVLSWTLLPDENGATPTVRVRRKERDFSFPPDLGRYVIHDGASFPPDGPGTTAHQLASTSGTADGLRWSEQTWTVVGAEPDGDVENLRYTERTFTRPDRSVVRREVELLDAGAGEAGALHAGRTYYYQLDTTSGPPSSLRATATPGGVYRYHQTLYEAVPAAYRRHDTVDRPEDEASAHLPEAKVVKGSGQLRRLLDVFASAVGALRSSADGLAGLRDVDVTDARFLPLLASWIGWGLTGDDVARQRQEILAAPARYRTVGTVAGVTEIVEHYTGWSVRIAESAQSIAMTNLPPQRNLFAATERAPDSWAAPDDAAPALGLAGASGRVVTGKNKEPFVLADRMRLSVSVDGGAPVGVPFAASDFADIAAARASEVAAAVARSLRGLDASAHDGKVRLRSPRDSDAARVTIQRSAASVVSLDGAPSGRLSTTTDPSGPPRTVDWVAYATTSSADGAPSLRLKARTGSRWYDAQPIGADPEPQADPALVAQGAAQLWCAWVSRPNGSHGRLRHRVGAIPEPRSAVLVGDRVAPFALRAGARLVLESSGQEATVTFGPGDVADLAAATAEEVQSHLNDQLSEQAGISGIGKVIAIADPHGAIVLATEATGPGVTLRVDQSRSTAAWALGFGGRDVTAEGAWSLAVDWGPASDVDGVPPGRHRDCTATVEPGGAVRLCWSNHDGTGWRLVESRWSPRIHASTGAGLKIVSLDGHVEGVGGLPADVDATALDVVGTRWICTRDGLFSRPVEGNGQKFTSSSTADGLASDVVRDAAIDPAGKLWVATAGGLSRLAGGQWKAFKVADGLPADDVRAVAAPMDGTVWVATSKGVAVLRDETWRLVADGLPSLQTRRLQPGPDGSMWVGSDRGLARIDRELRTVAVHDLSGVAAGANDVRDLTMLGSMLWLATGAGVVELPEGGDARLHSGATAGADGAACAAIVATDGRVWAATARGLVVRDRDGSWRVVADIRDAVRLTGAWSAPALVPDAGAGERDPHLLRDGNVLLLVAARRTRSANGGSWRLTLRRREPGSATWRNAVDLPSAGTVDREPTIARIPGGALQVYFRSDRSGGDRIWRLSVDDAGAASAPTIVTNGPGTDTNPAVLLTGANPTLLFRSDRQIDLALLAGAPDEPAHAGATARRFAGASTVVLADRERNLAQGRFDDLLEYTPQRPLGDPAAPDERYTPGTIAVYVGRGRADVPLAPGDADRVRQLLAPFLPATVRVVPIASD